MRECIEKYDRRNEVCNINRHKEQLLSELLQFLFEDELDRVGRDT